MKRKSRKIRKLMRSSKAKPQSRCGAGIQDGGSVASNLAEALMLAKYLERVGDHAQNIAEWVEYALTGRYKGEVLG